MTTKTKPAAPFLLLPSVGLETLAALSEPWKCPCGHYALLVLNRMGKTRCLNCSLPKSELPPA